MDSDALSTFSSHVHRRGGISHAAKFLHRSQPAISRRIALLEQELGVPLFERVTGRTLLSDAGRVLIPYAEARVAAAAQDAEQAIRALTKQASGPVSLAVTGTLADSRLSGIMKGFAKAYPDVALTLRAATSAEVSALVRRGEVHDRPARLVSIVHAISTVSRSCPRRLQVVLRARSSARGPAGETPVAARKRALDRLSRDPGRPEIAAAHVLRCFSRRGLGEVAWTAVDSSDGAEAARGVGLWSGAARTKPCRRGARFRRDVDDRGRRPLRESQRRHRHAARRLPQRSPHSACWTRFGATTALREDPVPE